jgi:hypothetical protein
VCTATGRDERDVVFGVVLRDDVIDDLPLFIVEDVDVV